MPSTSFSPWKRKVGLLWALESPGKWLSWEGISSTSLSSQLQQMCVLGIPAAVPAFSGSWSLPEGLPEFTGTLKCLLLLGDKWGHSVIAKDKKKFGNRLEKLINAKKISILDPLANWRSSNELIFRRESSFAFTITVQKAQQTLTVAMQYGRLFLQLGHRSSHSGSWKAQ